MSTRSILIKTLAVAALSTGAFLASHEVTAATPAVSRLADAPAPTIKETIQVEARKNVTHTFTAPAGKIPGRLTGRFTVKGKSAGIKGAHDDKLVGFKLVGPDSKVLLKLDHPEFGNFDVKIDSPGAYTFEFDNTGIIRNSARTVELEGNYQPG
jgi:hypothetical protein